MAITDLNFCITAAQVKEAKRWYGGHLMTRLKLQGHHADCAEEGYIVREVSRGTLISYGCACGGRFDITEVR